MKIVGQDEFQQELLKILDIFSSSECEIRPHCIITGPSGSGKSLSVKTLTEQHGVKYMEINAASLTKEGTSGNSVSKALSPLLNNSGKPTVVFVDEFDKLFISGNSNSDLAHETTNGVQNEFLKILESDTVSVFGDYGKYVNVPANNCLFVFAGAFNGEEDITLDRLRDLGIKTEFLGRVGIVLNILPLTLDDLYAILDQSQLLEKYLELFENVDRKDVIKMIRKHLKDTFEYNTIGARAVNTLINQYFINGGKLGSKEVKKTQFSKKLQLT